MEKFFRLVVNEFKIQNRVNNLTKYLCGFFLFSIFSISMICSRDNIQEYGTIFAVIEIPLCLLGFSYLVFRQDLEDGHLEFLLINFSGLKIVLAKTISVLLSCCIAGIINLPLVYIIFDIGLQKLLYLSAAMFMLFMLSTFIVVLIGSIQSYFRANTNFLSVLVMPIIIPSIIIAGMVVNKNSVHLIYIMFGINLIFFPIATILSGYLIKNVYNA